MSEKREFTPEELEEAKTMRGRGFTWLELGSKFQCSPQTIRSAIDPEFKKARSVWEKKNVAKRREWKGGELVREEKEFMQLPLEVHPVPTTLDQIMFGDPLPGRSALDQKGGVSY